MSIFFHVDVSRKLRPGMEIELGAGMISEFGKKCWKHFHRAGIKDIPRLEDSQSSVKNLDKFGRRELYLEIFRTGHPELSKLDTISRLNAFFAVRSIADAKRYIARSNFPSDLPIYEVQASGVGFEADSTWLDQEFPDDIRQYGYYYEMYWKGKEISQHPSLSVHEKRGTLIEVLFESDVTIGELVPAG